MDGNFTEGVLVGESTEPTDSVGVKPPKSLLSEPAVSTIHEKADREETSFNINKGLAAEYELHRLLMKKRYLSFFPEDSGKETPPSEEEIKKCAVPALQAWDYAYKKFDSLYWEGKGVSDEGDYWDHQAMELKGALGNIDTDFIKKWIEDPNFPAYKSLVRFISYELWFDWNSVKESLSGIEGDIRSYTVEMRDKFDRSKTLFLPLLKTATQKYAQKLDLDGLEEIFDTFKTIGMDEQATCFIDELGLNVEEKQKALVAYINVFGFISSVDLISGRIKTLKDGSPIKIELEQLYKEIQGEEVQKIIKDLSEVYKNIDFSKYDLNDHELTSFEADLIEKAIQSTKHSMRNKKDIKNTTVLDNAAGTGRHSRELTDRGFKKIIELEYEQKHVDQMKSAQPKMNVIRGDWKKLPLAKSWDTSKPVDFTYSLGRSISHNRTPTEMMHWFDEVTRVTEGGILIDQPDVDWGVYKERIEKLMKNLENIGVKPVKSTLIYDGPNELYKYNRMVLRPEQLEAYERLFGLKRVWTEEKQLGENVRNKYYCYDTETGSDPEYLSAHQLNEDLKSIGLFDPGQDLNLYIDRWGMTVGQALLYGLDNDHIRQQNKVGRGPKVSVEYKGSQLRLSASTTPQVSGE